MSISRASISRVSISGKSISSNHVVGLVLAVSLFVAANVQADYEVLESKFGYFQTAQDQGYGDSVTVTAQQSEDGRGVTFTFASTYDGVMQMQSKGSGNGILIYASGDAENVFNFAGFGTAQLSQLAAPYTGVSAYQTTNMNAGATMQGSSWLFDTTLSFTLNFAEGMGWEDFVANMDDLAIGVHLAPKGLASSMYIANDWKDPTADPPPPPSPPSTVVPEPATLVILGLGLAGLGLASRRRKTQEMPQEME